MHPTTLIAVDYSGLATVITALATLVVAVATLASVLGFRRPASEIHAAVTTPPDAGTLGQVVSDAAESVEQIKTALNGAIEHGAGEGAPHH